MKRLFLSLSLLVSLPLWALDYPVVYVRSPRDPGVPPKLPEVVFATVMDSGMDLVRLDPGGAQTVLYDCDTNCSVTDPSVSLDGRRVYFSVVHQPAHRYLQRIPFDGCSIYSLPAGGGAATPLVLASDGYTAGLPAGHTPPVKPCHLGPQELPNGRLVFTSTLWGQHPPKGVPTTVFNGFNAPSMQLFVRQSSGEIEPIAPMTIGSALHPILLTTGELMFTSLESQGHRDIRLWALWSIYPDGRNWRPLVSGFEAFSAFHFQAQRSSGAIAVTDYYNRNNWGFGTLLEVPMPRPVPAFHNVFERPCIPTGFGACTSMAFQPVGMSTLTPWTIATDRPAPCPADNPSCSPEQRVGKVTHPAAYPGNRLLLTYSAGPVTDNIEPTQPWPDTGVYLISGVTTTPNELELVINDPAYNEHLARVVAPYATIYGQAPVELPWLPQTSPHLPPGSPYGLVGSASVRVEHSETGPGAGQASFGGLDIFNSTENLTDGNWTTQGGDTSLYEEADVAAMRIVLLEPNRIGVPALRHFANERHRVLTGNGPCGDFPIESDGSFLVRVPADTPFTFQKISTRCESLTMAQTWHQVRPGEVRVDCGGCHYHSHKPIPWDQSLAAKRPPSIPIGVRNVTWLNRIAQLVDRIEGTLRGVALGALGPDAAYDCIANDREGDCSPSQLASGDWRQTNLSAFGNAYRSRRSLLWWEAIGERRDGHTNADHPDAGNEGDLDYLDQINFVPSLTAQELRDLATWIDLGMPYGEPAWDLDTARPVVHVEEPRPGEYEDVPRLLYGVADADSGIASIRVTASWSVARRPPGRNLHDLAHVVGDGVYELDLDGGECRVATCAQELTVTADDVDGNPRQVIRKFTRKKQGTANPTPVPPLPTATPGATPVRAPFPVAVSTPTASVP